MSSERYGVTITEASSSFRAVIAQQEPPWMAHKKGLNSRDGTAKLKSAEGKRARGRLIAISFASISAKKKKTGVAIPLMRRDVLHNTECASAFADCANSPGIFVFTFFERQTNAFRRSRKISYRYAASHEYPPRARPLRRALVENHR